MKKRYRHKKIIFHVALFLGTAISLGLLTYSIIQIVNRKTYTTKTAIFDWENIPKLYKSFSEENSFKIEFQTSDLQHGREGRILISSGTAWSWYYKQQSSTSIDWYLMTNFHVVNDAVAYINKFSYVNSENGNVEISNPEGLLSYYSSNIKTTIPNNYYFSLSQYKNDSYVPVVSTNMASKGGKRSKLSRYVKNIDVITDFDNENIDLFSKSDLYNLDMAIVKVSLDFSSGFPSNNLIANPYEMYSKYTEEQKNNVYPKDYKPTYIAGNPSKYKDNNSGELVAAIIDNSKWVKNEEDLKVKHPILKHLKAPYFFTFDSYKNFPLTEGSSGSAVYQVEKIGDNLYETVPVGIYWGGKTINYDESFVPSFIPFVVDNKYNIFSNFDKYINGNFQ